MARFQTETLPNLAGTHSCAGQSMVNNDPGEWRFVPKGTCADLKMAASGSQQTASNAPPVTQSTSTSSSDNNNEALSAQCTAETNRLLKEGTQAVARVNAQQDANMIRRGMLELARNLQTIISTNEGRCREGKSSVSDRFNALKMLQDVSLACNRGGYGADCDREKQEAVQTVARSQPAAATNTLKPRDESDPSAAANECVRINTGGSYSGFTNTCNFPISVIHCLDGGDLSAGDARFFSCHRPGGLWSKQTTAGNLGAGKTDRTHLGNGGMVKWYACKAPYSIRNARYEDGQMYANCVR